MDVAKISVNGAETIPQTVTMKGARNNTPETNTEEKSLKEALTDPMETVGRSQVNFKGSLSANDLNIIAESVAKLELKGKDITVLKKALSNVFAKEKISNIKQLKKTIANDLDKSIDFVMQVESEAYKINPNADIDKIGLVASTIF